METTPHDNSFPKSGGTGYGSGTASNVSSGAHAAVNSMASAADEAARNMKPTIDRYSGLAHQAVDKVAEAVAPTADWLGEQGETLNAAQKKLVQETCSYVSAHPLKSIGIALAAGFLLSRIIR